MRLMLAFAGLAVLTSGCATLKGAFVSYGPEDVEKAQKAGDFKFVAEVCAGTKSPRKGSNAQQDACDYKWLNEIKVEMDGWAKAGDMEKLMKWCAMGYEGGPPYPAHSDKAKEYACEVKKTTSVAAFAAAAGSCDTIKDAWAKRISVGTGDNPELATAAVADYEVAAAKYFECGLWDDFFEDLLVWGPGFTSASQFTDLGYKAMTKAQEGGVDIEAQILAYLGRKAAKPFPENSQYAVGSVVHFLVEQKKLGLCAKLLPAAKVGDAGTINKWLGYYEVAKCKEGVQLAVANLLSDFAPHRIYACQFIAGFGSKAELAKVKALAEGDAYSEVDGLVKIYPVRDACAGAAAKLNIKGK